MNRITKKSLELIVAGALSAGLLGGCAATQRVSLYETNHMTGKTTSSKYFAYVNEKETRLDATEADREARCLRELNQFKYKTVNQAYKELGSCVNLKRKGDMAKYMIGAVVVDGLKLYGLVSGVSNGASAASGSSSTSTSTTTVGTGSSTGYTWTPIR
jgi:hypothetical protein